MSLQRQLMIPTDSLTKVGRELMDERYKEYDRGIDATLLRIQELLDQGKSHDEIVGIMEGEDESA